MSSNTRKFIKSGLALGMVSPCIILSPSEEIKPSFIEWYAALDKVLDRPVLKIVLFSDPDFIAKHKVMTV